MDGWGVVIFLYYLSVIAYYSILPCTFGLGYFVKSLSPPPNRNLEDLKNRLLVYAVSEVMPEKISSYASPYDGTMMPSLSGLRPYFISDSISYWNSPFYNDETARKYKAAKTFLDNEFQTEEQVNDFFNEFLEMMKNEIQDCPVSH